MSKESGIWVFVQIDNEKIHYSTFELLAKARELSEVNKEKVVAILLEEKDSNNAKTLIGYGADEVIVIRDTNFKHYNPILYTDSIVYLAKKYNPSIFLFLATTLGRSLAPRVQGVLQNGLTADTLDLRINKDNKLEQIKPSYGDNLMCTIIVPETYPQVSTIRPNVFKALDFDENRVGVITLEKVSSNLDLDYEVLSYENIERNADSLSDANRIVAVGRGIKDKDNLAYIEQLATLLKTKVGVTRPLAENGWYTLDEQIGQSGVSVTPELILNFGIAGAIQYTVGMKDSDFVFSVNTDEKASIFNVSDYGYVGDAKEFLIELIKILS